MGYFGRLHLMVTRYLNHAGQSMRDSGIYFTIAHLLQIHACLFLYIIHVSKHAFCGKEYMYVVCFLMLLYFVIV